MSRRPVARGGQSPRDSVSIPPGSLRARDGGDSLISSPDSPRSDDDEANRAKTGGADAVLALRSALDGLSQSQLLSLADLARRAAQPTRAEKSERLRSIVDEHLQDLLTENALLSYTESWHELADADARSWSSIFSSFRPSAEFKPDLSQFPFHDLVDFRPKQTNPESTEVFKRFPKQQAIDECLKSLSDKQIRPLCRITMLALDLGSTDLPELDKPDEVKAHVDKMQTALIRVSQYILMLHSDVVHRRKLAALTAMGMKDHEATQSHRDALLDEQDFALMKSVNDRRREFASLRAQLQTKPGKGKGRGRGRGRGADRGRQSDSSVPGAAAQSTSQSAPKEHHSETAAPSRGTSPGSTKGTSTSSGRGRGRGNKK